MTLSVSKKSHLDKSRLGYNQTEKGSSSKTTEQETNPKSFAETIKGDKKIYKEDCRDTARYQIYKICRTEIKC
jgi:hypothetical protein